MFASNFSESELQTVHSHKNDGTSVIEASLTGNPFKERNLEMSRKEEREEQLGSSPA